MTETDYQCPHCGFSPLEQRKQVIDNEVQERGWYCPNCQYEYDEGTTFRWEELDFPLWVEISHHDDSWGMLREVAYQTTVPEDRIPAGEMKHTVFHVWFKITKDGSVAGPYDSKRGELV